MKKSNALANLNNGIKGFNKLGNNDSTIKLDQITDQLNHSLPVNCFFFEYINVRYNIKIPNPTPINCVPIIISPFVS